MNIRKIIPFIASVLVCEAAGILGSVFTSTSVRTWYPLLEKPSFNPPGYLFGPVWTILYFLMGVALFLVWDTKKDHPGRRIALMFFAAQLVLNAIWSPVFFGLQNPFLGLLVIIFLWCAILATMVYFYRVRRLTSILLLPYLLWVSFATVLNYFIWQMNK
jgi:translocator protein